jgi:ribosome maturation factor RimP
MIEKATIEEIIRKYIEGTDIFLVDIRLSPGNIIHITLDKPEGITIKECTAINRYVVSQLDKDAENFELEISSPGLGLPFKVFQQYQKNLGRNVEVILKDGIKVKGKLIGASTERIEIEEQKKIRKEGKKKPEYVVAITSYYMNEIKSTKLIVSFK